MSQGTKRSIFRCIHIVLSVPIIGYIYSPFDQIPNYAPATRFVFLPLMVVTGLWMWKGHVLRRLLSKGSAQQHAADNWLELVQEHIAFKGVLGGNGLRWPVGYDFTVVDASSQLVKTDAIFAKAAFECRQIYLLQVSDD